MLLECALTESDWFDLIAGVAELVDAHGSGPCGLKTSVEVRFLSSALINIRATDRIRSAREIFLHTIPLFCTEAF